MSRLRVWSERDRVVAARVRRAMAAGELVLYFQPTVVCRTGEIHAAESLVRWRRRSGELIAPGAWIGAIEASRWRNHFNLHVLELALERHRELDAQGVCLPLSVNITPACLADPDFVEAAERLLERRVSADAIRFEITERTTTINGEAIAENVQRFARNGVRFLLDDFGAGYSSLTRLASLSVHTLKIDGSLVGRIAESHHHRAIVEGVSRLAHSLGLDVVAEGVEDPACWTILQLIGCDRIQGYLVARPMPIEDFPDFLASYVPHPPSALPDPPIERRRLTQRRSGIERRSAPAGAVSP